MTAFHWLLTGGVLLVAVLALLKAQRAATRLERLTESYWELRYEQGQLRARLGRLDPESPAPAAPQATRSTPDAFVPLSSLKR